MMYTLSDDIWTTIDTPAKLNLFLELLGKREDGFHELETLMIGINIFDTVRFSSSSESGIQLECQWGRGVSARQIAQLRSASANADSFQYPRDDELIPSGNDNLVVRAVDLLRQAAGIDEGARIQLIKRIPSAAGLGGASSDAAATMIAASMHWKLGWSRSRLAKLAATLGSDIPYFFHQGTALCRGRGERVEPVAQRCGLSFVLVRPPVGLSTPRVFGHCQIPQHPVSAAPMIEALRQGDKRAIGQLLFNRLEAPAERLTPWIRKLRTAFQSVHCLGHHMSGSGSSYFGIFRSPKQAKRAACTLRAMRLGRVLDAQSLCQNHCFCP